MPLDLLQRSLAQLVYLQQVNVHENLSDGCSFEKIMLIIDNDKDQRSYLRALPNQNHRAVEKKEYYPALEGILISGFTCNQVFIQLAFLLDGGQKPSRFWQKLRKDI